jgi:uncharacterized DUF497 family protein
MLTFGVPQEDRLLAVVHAERGRAIRIIRARKTTRRGRGLYEQE